MGNHGCGHNGYIGHNSSTIQLYMEELHPLSSVRSQEHTIVYGLEEMLLNSDKILAKLRLTLLKAQQRMKSIADSILKGGMCLMKMGIECIGKCNHINNNLLQSTLVKSCLQGFMNPFKQWKRLV